MLDAHSPSGGAASSFLFYRKHALPFLALLATAALGLALLLPGGALHAQENGPIMYLENDTGPVATYTGVDPEGKSVTWSVAAAATDFSGVDGIAADDAVDAALFDIDKTTGVLTFKESPDFEMPRGEDIATGNTNTYKVVIEASDGAGDDAKTAYHAVTVNVEDVDEAATTTIELSSLQPRASVEIEVAYVDGVGNPFVDATGAANAAIVDPDGTDADKTETTIPAADVKWQWSRSSTRNGAFTDIPGDLAKTVAYTPDSGDVNRYLRLTATYKDGHGEDKTLTATSAYRVLPSRSTNSDPAFSDDFDTTEDGDQDPAAMLDDGSTEGDNVGDPITADDAQNDRLTYSFDTTTPTADADVFQIDRRTGQVTVGLGKTVSPAGDTDEPDTVTKQATFTVTIKATDPSGGFDTVELTITMDETDEAPVFTAGKTSHEYEENTEVATVVYTFAAYDPEAETRTFALSGDDASKFVLDDSSGELTFVASPNFEAPGDADKDNVYELTVKASDSSTPAKSTSIDVTVTVTNVEEPGSVALSASQPRIGIEIRANKPTDPDTGVTGVTWQWQRADAEDGPYADIKDATTAGYTPVTADDGKFLRAVASYTDAQGPGKTATGEPAAPNVAVAKVRNLAPVFADEDDDTPGIQINPRAVPENSDAGTSVTDPEAADPAAAAPVVATDTADADGGDDTAIFYILGGADAQYFEIDDADSDTGAVINVKSGTDLNHETKDTYTVTLTARDPEGLNSSVNVTINVTDVDEAPTIEEGSLSISGMGSVSYAENRRDAVATYTAMGSEAGMPTWSLEGADAGDFMLDGSGMSVMLRFRSSPDYEAPMDADNDNTYMVTVKATSGALMPPLMVTVMVTNVDEDGTVDLLPMTSLVGTAITATLSDPDGMISATTWQWSRSMTMDGTFTDISGATSASYTPVAGDATYYLKATASYTDGHGSGKSAMATTESAVRSGLAIAGSAVVSYAENGTNAVATYTAEGPRSASARWSIEGEDATAFDMDSSSGELSFKSPPDYENPTDVHGQNTYRVTVKASAGSYMDTLEVTVTVTNVGEDGTVTLSSMAPVVGTELTATLSDPDGMVSATTWQWSRSMTMDGTFTDISGATSASYTPVAGDATYYLKATASYTDGHGPSKEAMATASTAVAEAQPDTLLARYDADNSGAIEKAEMIKAINDYLFGTGTDAITKAQMVEVINLYLFG